MSDWLYVRWNQPVLPNLGDVDDCEGAMCELTLRPCAGPRVVHGGSLKEQVTFDARMPAIPGQINHATRCPMHIPKPFLVAILFTAFAALGAIHSTRAVAQTARTATCIWQVPGAPKMIGSEKAADQANGAVQAWMTSQLAAGATGFLLVPPLASTQYTSICAY